MNDIITNSIIDNYKLTAENWRRMYKKKKEENEQLHSIIEEVRELVQRYNILIGYYDGYDCYDETHDTYSHDTAKEELLEILNKENI